MEWIRIDRDKDGFATEECLDMMLNSLPFVAAEHTMVMMFYTQPYASYMIYMVGAEK